MQFQEAREGGYRIYAGALESPVGGGYTAALVVCRDGGSDAFRDERLSCGHRWPSADQALAFAVRLARELIRTRSARLRA